VTPADEQVTPAGEPVTPADEPVTGLVSRARDGDQHAWNELVERYVPLVESICRRYRLTRPDSDDIGQTVWLLLVEHLGELRQPAALPGWLATTTSRECQRVLRRAGRHGSPVPQADIKLAADQVAGTVEQELIEAELNAALRAAFAELQPRCQQLLAMLMTDPPLSYTEISAAASIPVGSIGPQRARCLDQIRRSPFLAALRDEPPGITGINDMGGEPRV
jgi:RNA polymerase sigma factor (sigma-70 family)